MSSFGHNFGAQGPMVTPGQAQAPQSFISPMLIEKIKAFINPMNQQAPQRMTPPIEPYQPGVMTRFQEPDYQGHHGFPEKPTGLGGLRPVGSLFPDQPRDEGGTGDPGTISRSEQFGKKGMAGVGGAVELEGMKERE